ncbi:MAG: inhibitor of KinA sporulation pathway (predicted exonuclease) [Saprospiraceae bacterium]|jgi:inhibitor of KinA sporulation pathway (predicted exonuclease)
MNFIIYDIEATCWEDRRGRASEIIEIGAIKVNDYAEVEDTFCQFVKPVIHPFLSPFCMELTSINQVDVNRADKFYAVVEAFQDWIDIFDEEYLLCSWGKYDKTQMIKDCQFHDMDWEWAEEHIDLKAQYKDYRKLSKPYGFKKALKREGFEFEGTHHRGIHDAYNLAKIFGKLFDVWQY